MIVVVRRGVVYLFVVLVCNGSLLQQKEKVSQVVAIENCNLTIFKHEILFQVQQFVTQNPTNPTNNSFGSC